MITVTFKFNLGDKVYFDGNHGYVALISTKKHGNNYYIKPLIPGYFESAWVEEDDLALYIEE